MTTGCWEGAGPGCEGPGGTSVLLGGTAAPGTGTDEGINHTASGLAPAEFVIKQSSMQKASMHELASHNSHGVHLCVLCSAEGCPTEICDIPA